MLQILRSVRRALVKRGELARYALYAVGEVVLVVVGILIALQVNNWNESRQSERERERILENLRADLVQEMDEFRYFIGLLEERERNTEYVLEILEDPPPEIDTAEAVENIVKVGWILVYEPTLATYNEIQSSGRLSLLDADTLKKRLAEYRAQIIDLNGINRTYDAGPRSTSGWPSRTFRRSHRLRTEAPSRGRRTARSEWTVRAWPPTSSWSIALGTSRTTRESRLLQRRGSFCLSPKTS